MRFKHTLLPQMREKFSSRYVFQKHVETTWVLRNALEIDLNHMDDTMNGCEIELSILYSLDMWSTCCAFMRSSFFIIFTHEYLDVFFFLTSRTCPKEPTWSGWYLILEWLSSRSLWCWPRTCPSRLSSPAFINYSIEYKPTNLN